MHVHLNDNSSLLLAFFLLGVVHDDVPNQIRSLSGESIQVLVTPDDAYLSLYVNPYVFGTDQTIVSTLIPPGDRNNKAIIKKRNMSDCYQLK